MPPAAHGMKYTSPKQRGTDVLQSSPDDDLTQSLGSDAESIMGEIDQYRLVRVLGEGGMGIVYLAEQLTPVRRQVALKLIKLGMDTNEVIARFKSERQALAILAHPNIAKIFDAGSTESGRPYFVMEYVPGIQIVHYCDRNRLTTEERLSLFIPVCRAIHHAHAKGIIHRDLKPSNIMVRIIDGKAQPIVIDFGVAKALDHHLGAGTVFTQEGRLIGTPEYMSPEQAEMTSLGIGPPTDVYSLGVVLHELLVGRLPIDSSLIRAAGIGGIQKLLREYEPPRPSTYLSSLGDDASKIADHRRTRATSLIHQIRGDLDIILMQAMAKDQTRRYSSAGELADDIARKLDSQPITARPISALYRFRKSIMRHRERSILMGIMLIFLVAILTTVVLQSRRTATLAIMESTLTALEASREPIRDPSYLGNAIQLNGEEVLLRNAFFDRRLPEDMAYRFARYLLRPHLTISAYVCPETSPVPFAVNRGLLRKWDILVVSELTLYLDGKREFVGPPQAPVKLSPYIPEKLLRDLPVGRHSMRLVISAWLFRLSEVQLFVEPFFVDNPVFHVDSALTVFRYGQGEEEWRDYWPRLLAGPNSIRVEELQYPEVEFEIVDQLPSGYPTPISSPELDTAMTSAISLERFYFLRGPFLCYQVIAKRRLPCHLAGRLTFYGPGGEVLAATDIQLRQGEVENYNTCLRLELGFGKAAEEELKSQLASYPAELPITARLEADRSVAIGAQGFDNYWSGSLEFRGKGSLRTGKRQSNENEP